MSKTSQLGRRHFTCLLWGSAALWPLKTRSQPKPERGEDPADFAVRFYREYMEPGVALKPLRERWFTAQFEDIIGAFYANNNPTQKVTEGDPILPWKNWDSAWRHKLKAEVLEASPDQARVLVTLAIDDSGHPLTRMVHLVSGGSSWRIDNVTKP